MAALTVSAAITPYNGKWGPKGCIRKNFSGAGVAVSEIAAAATGIRHVIVDGRVSFEGAGGFDISSGAAVTDQIEFAARGTATLPRGWETVEGEAMSFTNADAATVRGWVIYMSIGDGQEVPFI